MNDDKTKAVEKTAPTTSNTDFITPEQPAQYDFSKLPKILTDKKNFVLWKYEVVDGRKTKVPYNVYNGKKSKANTPETWAPFQLAVDTYNKGGYDGIGYVFDGDGIVGVDIDHCVEGRNISPLAMEIIKKCNSYTECSPSKTGIHIYIFDPTAADITKDKTGRKFTDYGVEIYHTGRYFTLTGLKLNNVPDEIKQSSITNDLIERFDAAKQAKKFQPTLNVDADQRDVKFPQSNMKGYFSDDEVIDKILNSQESNKFSLLFHDGDIVEHGGDDSAADMALLNILAFWTNKDAAQMERIFSQSALANREKWQRQDYRQRTIQKAIDDVTATYDPHYKSNAGQSTNTNNTKSDKSTGADEQPDPLKIPDDTLKELRYYHNTDAGNAERLIKCYGQKFFYYIEDYSRWLDYKAPLWNIAPDSNNHSVAYLVLKMAKQIQQKIDEPLQDYQDKLAKVLNIETDIFENTFKDYKDAINKIIKDIPKKEAEKKKEANSLFCQICALEKMMLEAKALENKHKYNPALDTVKTFPTIRITSHKLNTDDMLLNTPTGIVDLTTGKLYPHDSKYLFTQCTGAEYRQGYHNEIVDQFLIDVLPDDEDREAFLLFGGYSLTGSTKEEKALLLTGGGRNGKGSCTKSILQALGNKDNGFAVPFKIDSILQSTYTKDGDAASPEFAKLQHKRCAISEEIPKGRKLNEALFKQLTGGDPLSARRLRCDPFVIEPKFKMILSGNYLPELDNSHDIGLRERLLIVPFTQSFTGDKCNPNLKNLLLSPECQCALLSLFVKYCLKWQKSGLLVSKNMANFKQSYLDENDTVGNFIDECCNYDDNKFITRTAFLRRIRSWKGGNVAGMTDQAITVAVRAIDGIGYLRTHTGFKFTGICWKDEGQTGLDEMFETTQTTPDEPDLPY